jgi:archaemetzincin
MKRVVRHGQTALFLLVMLFACRADRDLPLKRSGIVLVPIGAVPMAVLAHLQRGLPSILKRDVIIGAAIPLPKRALVASRNQYLGSALLDDLEQHDVPQAERVVGVIDADAFAPGLNFIFGQAKLPGRYAVVALPRLRDSFRGRPKNVAKFHDRALKETVHELGHTFGFEHCPNRKCVMHFSNSFGDTDYKNAQFCEREQLPE